MFRKITMLVCAVATGPFLPGTVVAEDGVLTSAANVGVFSQYVFRGITQTDEDPALQGGFDASHASGLYAGLWGSNVSWISDFGNSDGGSSLEIDLYGGYRGTFAGGDLGYDVGLLHYAYPGDTTGGFDPDTVELYGGITYKWASLKLYYSLGDYFGFEGDTGDNGSDGTIYYDLSVNMPVGEHGVTVNLHYGYLDVENDLPSSSELSCMDWKVGASYALPHDHTVGVFLTGTNAEPGFYTTPAGKNTSDDQFVAFLSRVF